MTSFLSSIGKKRLQTPEQLVGSWKDAVMAVVRQHNLALAALAEEETATAAVGSDGSSLHRCTFGEVLIGGATSGSSMSSELEMISKSLTAIKGFLGRPNGDLNGDSVSVGDSISDLERSVEVSRSIQSAAVLPLCLSPSCMLHLPLDIRKDVSVLFCLLLRRNLCSFVNHLSSNTLIIDLLVDSFSQPYALSCIPMVREVVRLEQFCRYVLFSEGGALMWRFFDEFVLLQHFEVAAAAFDLVRELLHTHRSTPSPASQFMETHTLQLIDKFNVLIDSDNYITRRRSLKLLSEILLDHNNYSFMMSYISSRSNLKIVMNLLRHKSSAQIQLEAFHIFKVFVANPKKAAEVEEVLSQNKARLIAYLQPFHSYKDKDDPQFVDEKRLLLDTLALLKDKERDKDKEHTSSSLSLCDHHRGEAKSSSSTCDLSSIEVASPLLIAQCPPPPHGDADVPPSPLAMFPLSEPTSNAIGPPASSSLAVHAVQEPPPPPASSSSSVHAVLEPPPPPPASSSLSVPAVLESYALSSSSGGVDGTALTTTEDTEDSCLTPTATATAAAEEDHDAMTCSCCL